MENFLGIDQVRWINSKLADEKYAELIADGNHAKILEIMRLDVVIIDRQNSFATYRTIADKFGLAVMASIRGPLSASTDDVEKFIHNQLDNVSTTTDGIAGLLIGCEQGRVAIDALCLKLGLGADMAAEFKAWGQIEVPEIDDKLQRPGRHQDIAEAIRRKDEVS